MCCIGQSVIYVWMYVWLYVFYFRLHMHQRHIPLWGGNPTICWGRRIWLIKTYYPPPKKTWFHFAHFVLWCSKLHHNVSLHLWDTNYVTVYELTCFRVACIQCHVFIINCFYIVLSPPEIRSYWYQSCRQWSLNFICKDIQLHFV